MGLRFNSLFLGLLLVGCFTPPSEKDPNSNNGSPDAGKVGITVTSTNTNVSCNTPGAPCAEEGFLCLDDNKCHRGCERDADCTAAGESCVQEACRIPECTLDEDCAPRMNLCHESANCDRGLCVFTEIVCNSPASTFECLNGDTTFRQYESKGRCSPDSGECVYPVSVEITCENCTDACLTPCESLDCPSQTCQTSFCQINDSGGTPNCGYKIEADRAQCSQTDGSNGLCQAGSCVECIRDSDCADVSACTEDLCSLGLCVHNPITGTEEVCDGLDNDCDGHVDELEPRACSTACGSGSERCINGIWTPCDAQVPETETCDGEDNDCDGEIDELEDGDGDGFFPCDGDCDDSNSATYPGAPEICDGEDNNCDGTPDEGLLNIYFFDGDGDGVGVATNSITACTSPGPEWVESSNDCDDTNPTVAPGKPEYCDSVDRNCDGDPYDVGCTHGDEWLDCEIYASGTPTGVFANSFYARQVGVACTANEFCGTYWAKCRTKAAGDGHSHTVEFMMYDDGFTNVIAADDRHTVSTAGGTVPSGLIQDGTGARRRWFGSPVVSTEWGHTHQIDCHTLDAGFANLSEPSDAIRWNDPGLNFCTLGGTCRKFFGCKVR